MLTAKYAKNASINPKMPSKTDKKNASGFKRVKITISFTDMTIQSLSFVLDVYQGTEKRKNVKEVT